MHRERTLAILLGVDIGGAIGCWRRMPKGEREEVPEPQDCEFKWETFNQNKVESRAK